MGNTRKQVRHDPAEGRRGRDVRREIEEQEALEEFLRQRDTATRTRSPRDGRGAAKNGGQPRR